MSRHQDNHRAKHIADDTTTHSESTSIPEHTQTEKQEHPIIEIIRFSIIALLIVIPIRMFIAQPFIVSGASMDDTFHHGEYLIVDQVTNQNEEHPDGFVLDEPYIKGMRTSGNLTETLGEREYFVMGDNRDESSDSRAWGLVQEDQIVGRAFLRLFPPTELELLPGDVSITGNELPL